MPSSPLAQLLSSGTLAAAGVWLIGHVSGGRVAVSLELGGPGFWFILCSTITVSVRVKICPDAMSLDYISESVSNFELILKLAEISLSI